MLTATDLDAGGFVDSLLQNGSSPVYAPEELAAIAAQFAEYFDGTRRQFDLDVDLSTLTPFQRLVLAAVAEVRWGEVRSYRDIAGAIGKPAAARAVGGALAVNPISIVIPCHRIIKSDGSVGYYGLRNHGERGVQRKLRLLALEGIGPGKGLAK